ncbi:hypothetical protein AQUCO_00300737v1 [Aquilegia coerulea]|uniref:Beta-glucosidase n=1 Tax=Aquilegia coerulea TaxID=218851 RepID=A0A2G5F0J1_AQUCA|nr:hypothetical protein AQUCO_00300737v1 [Aquilegia coerulea]
MQVKQKGVIGINLFSFACTPMTNSTADIEAARRATTFYTDWVMNPMVFGDYPETMKNIVGLRLPSFTQHESQLLKGSSDFIGMNHYFTLYIEDDPQSTPGDFISDMGVKSSGLLHCYFKVHI